ncbi:hypothetical protein BDR05DRAFT_998241 [Suillus weaverae]|nr:hypothetical protein BDR05DRAFT_998241 [Suillus weaverae]
MSSCRNLPRSSSSQPIPPHSSHLLSLSLPSPPPMAPMPRASSPTPSTPSSGPGSPTSLNLNKLEVAMTASRSTPRLDPPALTLEPPTSPESGSRHQRVPTSPPHALTVPSSPCPTTKCQWGVTPSSKKGKSKEISAPVPASSTPSHLSPNLWALLSASSASGLASSAPSSS